MAMLRIVVGAGNADCSAILKLSTGLASAAQGMGLAIVSNKASRNPTSPSRYLTLRDAGGRKWLIRVSNHRIPVRNNHPLPHLDLVSIDGASGLSEATAFLRQIATGVATWFDSTDPVHRRDLKRTHRRRR